MKIIQKILNIKYKILGVDDLSLADMFEKLETIHNKINFDGGYALNQTTLEQIFISMASKNKHNQNDT